MEVMMATRQLYADQSIEDINNINLIDSSINNGVKKS